MFKEITLQNFLSYGPEGMSITLRPLNVLLGANGTGKSNLMEAIALLAASAREEGLSAHFRQGGISEWIYKGASDVKRALKVEVVVEQTDRTGTTPSHRAARPDLRHRVQIADVGGRPEVIDERIENAKPLPNKRKPFFYFGYEAGIPRLHVNDEKRGLTRESVRPDDSILVQRSDPDAYPVLTWLSKQYREIRFYREWTFGPRAACRPACMTQQHRADFLEPDGGNLALILNNITRLPSMKKRFDSMLQSLSPGFEGFTTTIVGTTFQLFLIERGDRLISTERLSDGTLRFLALLSILLHPEPPPVVVLEEPEMGVHIDLLPTIAKLLVEASRRMQLFVTTHSDILVDALTDHHESVLFCDKEEQSTVIRRAAPEAVEAWCGKGAKDRKGLGQAWLSGAFGGKRW